MRKAALRPATWSSDRPAGSRHAGYPRMHPLPLARSRFPSSSRVSVEPTSSLSSASPP
jgi:hypothetical protein